MTQHDKTRDAFRQAMELLIHRRAPGISPELFSDLFERLIWLEDDNGEAILSVLVEWLSEEDSFKVWVALGIRDVFLFCTKGEMVTAFVDLIERRPDTRSRCDEITEEWDRSLGSRKD